MNNTVAVVLPWDVVLSALATLIGVLVGGAISSRAQTRHWTLTTQADACAGVLREYTEVSIALARPSYDRELRPEGKPLLDWVPWNQALAVLTLVADHRIVSAADRIDAVFREVSRRVGRGELEGPKWFEAATAWSPPDWTSSTSLDNC
jgi:hypothetical protein